MAKKRSTSKENCQSSTKQTSLLSFWGPQTALKLSRYGCNDADGLKKVKETPVPQRLANCLLSSITENAMVLESRRIDQLTNAFEESLNKTGPSQTKSSLVTPVESSLSELQNMPPDELPAKDRKEEKSYDSLMGAHSNDDDGNSSVSSVEDQITTKYEVVVNSQSSDENHGNDPPLSEYEKLRLRNIERNNARLAALGLLHNIATTTTKGLSINATKRKRPAKHSANSLPQPPTRRSNRNRKNVLVENSGYGSNTIEVFDTILSQEQATTVTLDTANLQYTFSPLYQYSSMNRNTNATNIAAVDFSAMTTLQITGQRCVSPTGLSAIYSLDFWENLEDTFGSKQQQDPWLVGAGKAGMISIWNINQSALYSNPAESDDWANGQPELYSSTIDPILAWKAHSGRWIADAKFLVENNHSKTPQRLLTAGNDGTICLWDLCRVCNDIPKLLVQSDKGWHSSGIFCLDVGGAPESTMTICTGSKDKTIAVSNMETFSGGNSLPHWRSYFHSAKVGAVQLKESQRYILASASDDGLVAIHDYRMNGGNKTSVIAQLEYAHKRPHSVVWDPMEENFLVTAGMDPFIKLWDWRNLSQPLAIMEGHVPVGRPCKKIHRPVFLQRSKSNKNYILSGGGGSGAISTFKIDYENPIDNVNSKVKTMLLSRGELPEDCIDAGCIAVHGGLVAVSVDKGDILLLQPTS